MASNDSDGRGITATTAPEEPKTMTVALRSIRRGAKACQLCKQQKVRCEGGNPEAGQSCRRCLEANAICSVVDGKAPTISERLAALEDEVSSYKTALQDSQILLSTIIGKIATSAGIEVPEEVHKLENHGSRTPVSGSDLPSLPQGKKRSQPSASTDSAVSSTQRGKKARLENDESLLKIAAEIFLQRCAPYMPYIDLSATPSELLVKTKNDSELLYHAIVASGSREADELHDIHDRSHAELVTLVRATLFGSATLYDLQGLLIYIQFLTDAKFTGNAVDIAWSLDLHLAGHRLSLSLQDGSKLQDTLRYAEEIRVLGSLFNVERRAAILAGKPSLFGDQPSITEHLGLLTTLTIATDEDRRMLMCAELLSFTYKHVRDYTRVDAALPINEQDLGRLRDASSYLDVWRQRWLAWATHVPDHPGMFTMKASVEINCSFAKFHLYCHYVGGISDVRDASPSQFELMRSAIEHAIASLQTAIEHFPPPVINYATRVLCTTITFACLFSLKMVNLHPTLCHPPKVLAMAQQIEKLFGHYSDKRFAQAIGAALQASQTESQWLTQQPQGIEDANSLVDTTDFGDFDFSEALRFLSAENGPAFDGLLNWQQTVPDDLFLCSQMGSLSNSAIEEFMRL